MRISQIYQSNSDWLRAADLQGPVNVTIVGTEMHTFEDKDTGRKKDQLVLIFEGWDKKLGLNATNATRLATLLGDETDNWAGHTITLYVEQNVKTPTGHAPAIRIMPMLPGAVQQQPRPGAAPYNKPQGLPPVPHTAVGNAVQGVVARQGQRRPAPPPIDEGDIPSWVTE